MCAPVPDPSISTGSLGQESGASDPSSLCPIVYFFKAKIYFSGLRGLDLQPSSCCHSLMSPLDIILLAFEFLLVFIFLWASLVAYAVKNPPAMQETQVRSLALEDPLEKGMAPHSSMLAWRIPRTEGLMCHRPWSCKELDAAEQLALLTVYLFFFDFYFFLICSEFCHTLK